MRPLPHRFYWMLDVKAMGNIAVLQSITVAAARWGKGKVIDWREANFCKKVFF